MRLKTYMVADVSEALPLIKRDLGEDALILNTKKVKTGGIFGLFQKEQLEVTAAVETKAQAKAKRPEEPQPEPVAQTQAPAELLEELQHIKRFMMNAVKEEGFPEALQPIRKRLVEQEVGESVQADILAKLMQELERQPDLGAAALERLAQNELLAFVRSNLQPLPAVRGDIICFVGPTGVGKTTTIAKIAADYMLKQQKKVGLITADTYRIAAVDQLKTYADILGIPLEVVDSPAALEPALAKLGDCDVVLMDTAGRNYQQQQYIEDLGGLLAGKADIHTSLVLSLTAKYADMKKIMRNFEAFDIHELILTKQDETHSAGAIINLLADFRLPLSYIANGQNVPDDLVPATPERIVAMLWEDRADD